MLGSIKIKNFYILILFLLSFFYSRVNAQEFEKPRIMAHIISEPIKIDGVMDEEMWNSAQVIEEFRTIVPEEGGIPSEKTTVRILAHPKYIVFGIECFDSKPERIVNFSKLRDSELRNEDHIRLVIDPFLDGQSGIIFAVNASGARYDALVANRGESENEDWDAIWEARTHISKEGWKVEIKLPIQSFSFNKNLKEWGFNIERRIQRNQETIRWTNIGRDQWLIRTSRAGLITNLPDFDYGVGLTVRPSLITRFNKSKSENYSTTLDPSLEVIQRIGSNIVSTVTVNTDFAETEVDTRQTNLTRFPLFFPEKRAFFLEGADIFEFGLGMGRDIIPFFSRRIGLNDGNEIPILAGTKLNGRVGKTAFGGLAMRTRETITDSETIPPATMGVIRVKQNVLKESSIGYIGTYGDPYSTLGTATNGIDLTYQTTSFNKDKNFLIGLSGMMVNRPDLEGDRSALAFKVDYPNDIWDMAFTYLRIGDDFDPSLGFVPRKAMNSYNARITYAPRPSWKWLRQMRNEFFVYYVTDLKRNWESYRIFTAPINWRLESGDRFEFNYVPTGERIVIPFSLADNVTIPAGSYHFTRYRLEASLAAKRGVNGQLTWWFGTFYDGWLNEYEASLNLNPSSILNFEVASNYNQGRLPFGDFDQTLLGVRIRYNVSADLQINSFIQYDTESKTFGINARIHWIYHPQGDFFLVFNHNVQEELGNRSLLSQQIILKGRYNFRM